MKKSVVFRADGNSEIGLGHLYRLFALFEILKGDYSCSFVTKENSATHVIPKDYVVKLMPQDLKLEDEAQWLKKYFENKTTIIADGYQFKSDYQKSIKDADFKLVYIDDLQEYHMFADLVLNHAPGILAENYKSESYTEFALGTDYAILRPLFLEAAKKSRKIEKIDTAFICFGGSDPFDLTFKAAQAVLEIHTIKNINVVIGGAYKHKYIFELQKEIPKLNIYQNLSEKELIDVMYESHFAIASSSNILFEIMAVKMPIVSGYYVENQKRFYQYIKSQNIVIGLDELSTISVNEIIKTISEFLINFRENTYKETSFIDGEQAIRLKNKIKNLLL